MKGVLRLARAHEVSIDSNYASLCISVCVIGALAGQPWSACSGAAALPSPACLAGWHGQRLHTAGAAAAPRWHASEAHTPPLLLPPPAVGFATSLDPRVNIMDAAAPCFLYHALTGRVNGRLYM